MLAGHQRQGGFLVGGSEAVPARSFEHQADHAADGGIAIDNDHGTARGPGPGDHAGGAGWFTHMAILAAAQWNIPSVSPGNALQSHISTGIERVSGERGGHPVNNGWRRSWNFIGSGRAGLFGHSQSVSEW
ncbi:MAG: hypothetical protein AMXMBFR80_02610 [Dehalococcoidia bacterium]